LASATDYKLRNEDWKTEEKTKNYINYNERSSSILANKAWETPKIT
jgi:hypothetical protein